MITRETIRDMVKTMHHGGCENWLIARTVARCARTLAMEEAVLGLHDPMNTNNVTQAIVDDLRAEGWFV